MSYITSGRDPRAGMRGGVSGYHTDGVGALPDPGALFNTLISDGTAAARAFVVDPTGANAAAAAAAAAKAKAVAEANAKAAAAAAAAQALAKAKAIALAEAAQNAQRRAAIAARDARAGGGGFGIQTSADGTGTGPNVKVIGGLAVAAVVLFMLAKKVG